jgi:hypothetical protein
MRGDCPEPRENGCTLLPVGRGPNRYEARHQGSREGCRYRFTRAILAALGAVGAIAMVSVGTAGSGQGECSERWAAERSEAAPEAWRAQDRTRRAHCGIAD